MPKFSVLIRFVLSAGLLALMVLGCKEKAGVANASKPGKWIPYNEKTAAADQTLRSKLKLERREAKSNSLSDSGEVWFNSEVVLYNEFGQEVLKQETDITGKILKETRNDYRDSLLVRQAINEASGYSSAIQYTYDDKGLKIGELLFQRGDSVMRRWYTHDQYGNETEVRLLKMRDSSQFKLITGRDSLGRPATVKETKGEATNWSEIYVLTDTLWRIKRTNGDGKLQSDYEMRFDKNGGMIRMKHLDAEGKLRLQVDYVNDANGRPTKETFFGGNGQLFQTYDYLYDENGLLVERRLTTPTQPFVLTTKYSYIYRR
jgi:hypothetical protein